MQSSFGVDPQDAESGRVPWNDSTVVGFPDSPPPFEVVQLYSHLDIPKPMGVTALPGTSDLLVHVHQGGYGGPGRLLRVSPGAANSKETKGELEEFLVLDEPVALRQSA